MYIYISAGAYISMHVHDCFCIYIQVSLNSCLHITMYHEFVLCTCISITICIHMNWWTWHKENITLTPYMCYNYNMHPHEHDTERYYFICHITSQSLTILFSKCRRICFCILNFLYATFKKARIISMIDIYLCTWDWVHKYGSCE